MTLQVKQLFHSAHLQARGIGDSGKLLEEEAGTGNWLDGMRFRSSASEDDVKSWVDGLEK